jgi:predicted ATPase/class 3 adenylate cyclase/DNA-binding CsgD family transcriptional regulator
VNVQLPTGTVTLLLADVEDSTRLWETHPEEMTAALVLLDRAVSAIVADLGGVRPVQQSEGNGFAVAFARASDAVACALELQRAQLGPIRLRIGVHTGEVLQLRDDGNYIGPTVNRTARLRDLARGGQTVLSGTTRDVVVDRLPRDAWLTDLGTHPLRDMPRPERVVQLCHPELRNDFPPLRTFNPVAALHLPVQLTNFVGRGDEIKDVRRVLAGNRLVTLTGAGGSGKTRLALQVASDTVGEFSDGVWLVDLAPITDPDVVPVAAARALGLPDQPGHSTMATLTRFIGDRHMLVVLDNCEHLLDASTALIVALLGACPSLVLLATSREPIGVPGEVTWRVPSLSLADEAIELFTDRARRARPDFSITSDTTATVAEVCRRLDGMPLAIELAAARVRTLSLTEILDSLHDHFRLLTGGARTAVPRQQTLRASVDWSHALLTESERNLFHRLAAFNGGFDLDAAQAVCGGAELQRHQVFDQLTLLVDKSLVVAEDSPRGTRYRLLETVRQYAQEKLGESGESDAVRARHRDHYTAVAAALDSPARDGHERHIEQAEIEIDNLRAVFAWSLDNSAIELALQLASALQPLWLNRGRIREGASWLGAALADDHARQPVVAAAVRARALADMALLNGWAGATDSMAQAEQALALARQVDDPVLLARVLASCAAINCYNLELARPYFAEAIGLAREIGDSWRLSQILAWQAYAAFVAGDPIAARAASEEGRDLADAIGDRLNSRQCRCWGVLAAQWMSGDLVGAVAQMRDLVAEADADGDVTQRFNGLIMEAHLLAFQGKTGEARAAAEAAIEAGAELGGVFPGIGQIALAAAALAAGDAAVAEEADERTWQDISLELEVSNINVWRRAAASLATGDLAAARRWADEAISATTGWHMMAGLTTRARVALAQGEPEAAERDAHDALACAVGIAAVVGVADILECLADLAGRAGSLREAARYWGSAESIRACTGEVRFKIFDATWIASVEAARDALGGSDFETAWAEGAALSTNEAIAYAQRGRGERRRPASGWASLTPTERDVVRLLGEGLANKDIATRLFISPRTVQAHLTHIYAKLELRSRVQLAQEAARHI